jgi:hypothetical protein
MGNLQEIVFFCESVGAIVAFVVLCIKPIRKWLFTDKEQREGLKCLLRSEMLRVYYRNKDDKRIRQYELELFIACYKAYKALKGNSFIDEIAKEVYSWEITT